MIDAYLFTLCLGFGGLSLMALLGLGHHHSSGGNHGSGSHGHHGCQGNHGGNHAVSRMAMHHGHHGSHANPHGAETANNLAETVMALFSPRIAFTLLMGFGAAGTLLRPVISAAWLLCFLALAGAVAFEYLLVSRLWRFLFRFASDPARLLDSTVLEEGRAVTDFDNTGHGLIALHLDGQLRQVLGALCPEERSVGWRIRTGDRLFIKAVDCQRNTCTVSLLP